MAQAQGQPDFDRYVKFMKGQLRELLTNYGPLGILWFDGEWENTWTHERGKDLEAYRPRLTARHHHQQPRGQESRRHEGAEQGRRAVGDYGTPEQQIPASGLPGVDWESCMTMNNHWGYNKNDQNWKSSATMIRMLIDVASKGGNLLMNVGPTSEGLIPGPSIERLREIGKWMKPNGEAIYGTRASPFSKAPAWGRVTRKPGKLYLHVFDWPKDGRLVLAEKGVLPVTAAYLLADPQRTPLRVTQDPDGVELAVPVQAPDRIASVIVLETSDSSAMPATERTPRLADWERLKYGMFVHFGMSTFEGVDISDGEIAVDHLRPYATRRAAMGPHGQTGRHEVHGAYGQARPRPLPLAERRLRLQRGHQRQQTDVVAEFMKACKEEGIKPGLYYCVLDSRNEGGLDYRAAGRRRVFPAHQTPAHGTAHAAIRAFASNGSTAPRNSARNSGRNFTRSIKGLNPECLVLMNAGLHERC